MELYFLRHGKAADPVDSGPSGDFRRALTEKGITEMEAECKALDALGVCPDVILTSPLVRARETACIAAKRLGMKGEVIETELLAPGLDADRLRKLLAEHRDCESIMLVGHEPDFSTLVGELIGGGNIEMKKGGLALVSIERSLRRGSGTLHWLVPPKILMGA